MIGVVLAGGRASRLPNKALLPIYGGFPMICSGITYLLDNNVRKIVVMEPPDGSILRWLVPHIFNKIPATMFQFATDYYDGVVGGIQCAAPFASEGEPVMYVCCDNIYPTKEQNLDPSWVTDTAIVRSVPSGWYDHLDRYEVSITGGGEWKHRTNIVDENANVYALTTPWVLSYKTVKEAYKYDALIDFFNGEKITPVVLPKQDWQDLGTVESYTDFWSNQ